MVDPEELRGLLARVPAPVTVVTAYDVTGSPVGFTASSFVSISASPPLVGVFVGQFSRSYVPFQQVSHLAVNILADHQTETAVIFAGKSDDKFASVALDPAFPDAPVLASCLGTLVGRVDARPVLGDHLMLVVHVEAVVRRVRAPLVYQDRKFRVLTDLLL